MAMSVKFEICDVLRKPTVNPGAVACPTQIRPPTANARVGGLSGRGPLSTWISYRIPADYRADQEPGQVAIAIVWRAYGGSFWSDEIACTVDRANAKPDHVTEQLRKVEQIIVKNA